MAYTLQTLIQILEQDQHHLTLDIKPRIECLLKKARFLRDLFSDNSSHIPNRKGIGDLDARTRKAVYRSEDVIESYIRNQVLAEHVDVPAATSQLDLTDLMDELDSITNEVLEIQTDPAPAVVVSPSPDPDLGSKSKVVGLGKDNPDFLQLLTLLTEPEKRRKTICIVGTGGIGKTTLARQLYNFPRSVDHFHKRAWVTISQTIDLRTTLLSILECLKPITDEIQNKNDNELGFHVNRILSGSTYFIVLDNIWETEAWSDLISFFPNDNMGSRILLTTRDPTVAYATISRHHRMSLMNEDTSWELLCWKVFAEATCPPELEQIGKRIVKRCQGLPLAIISIAQILSKSNKKLQNWEHVAMNVSSSDLCLDSDLDILSMSYSNLPWHLKPCFLYVGVFPEDYEIQASKVIKLWISEGFVKPNAEKILEDIAEGYLMALIDADLLLVCKKEPNGKPKTLKTHFLFRELCRKKAVEEEFLWFQNSEDHNFPEDYEFLRRVSAHPLVQPQETVKLTPLVRSFLCIGRASQRLAPLFLGLTLLRVLDVFQIEFFHFPKEILGFVNLRYLAISCYSALPSTVSRLINLQFLVVRRLPSFRPVSLPPELWKLTQLMYIKCKETCIWNSPKNEEFLTKLQNLSTIQTFQVTNELIHYIPNLRKLGLSCNQALNGHIHLDRLLKLEKLKCSSNMSWATHEFLSYIIFPQSLRKLTLRSCKIPSGFMSYVGSLPRLQHLKLQKCAFSGYFPINDPPRLLETHPVTPMISRDEKELALEPNNLKRDATEAPSWELLEGQFNELLSLQMEDLNLVHWWQDAGSCLPKLEHLTVRAGSSIVELPLGIEEISSLQLIEVDEHCSQTVIAWASEIRKEQEDYGYDTLEVRVCQTQGISQSREYAELMNLNEQEVDKKERMEAKRKCYMQKLKGTMRIGYV